MAEENPENAEQGAPEAGEQQAEPVFDIKKVYLKDISFESPNAPDIFVEKEWTPDLDVQMHTKSRRIGKGLYEVVLYVTVTAKLGEKAAYLVEVQQAGLFQVDGFERDDKRGLLGSYCPGVLHPFAREAVADQISKGGFPPHMLGPVNFEALYQRHLEQEAAQEQSEQQGQAAESAGQ